MDHEFKMNNNESWEGGREGGGGENHDSYCLTSKRMPEESGWARSRQRRHGQGRGCLRIVATAPLGAEGRTWLGRVNVGTLACMRKHLPCYAQATWLCARAFLKQLALLGSKIADSVLEYIHILFLAQECRRKWEAEGGINVMDRTKSRAGSGREGDEGR